MLSYVSVNNIWLHEDENNKEYGNDIYYYKSKCIYNSHPLFLSTLLIDKFYSSNRVICGCFDDEYNDNEL